MKRLFAYFEMRKAEQIAFYTMSAIILLLVLIQAIRRPSNNDQHLAAHIVQLSAELADSTHLPPPINAKSQQGQAQQGTDDIKKTVTYFEFDPNNLPAARWRKLGLSDAQIRVIHNYESKGGYFRVPEDIKKLYSLSDHDVNRLLPYVKIDNQKSILTRVESKNQFVNSESPISRYADLMIELNTADSLALIALRGIGPVYSSRIVKYRELLGGYYELEQLKEVYGLPIETVEHISKHLFIDPESISKIKINTLDAGAISKHPYISYKQAKTIVNYRKQHGHFSSIEDLKKILSLQEPFFRKIEIYLDFN